VDSDVAWEGREGVSLLAVSAILLRNRRIVLAWMVGGALLAGVAVLFRPSEYKASASFIPSETDASRSGLASLAGQFAISLPSGGPGVSPDFYSTLLKSRVLLERVARDTITVPERGNARLSMNDLLDVSKGTPAEREVETIKRLDDIVQTSVVKATGIVRLSVVTKWPSVSYEIARTLVDGVDLFNRRTRQGKAAAERAFIEDRLSAATADLRGAEDHLEKFLIANRQFAASPDLTFQRDRLQREVTVRQQVVSTLTQSYEDVRIREVRDTPLITVIEPPIIPAVPEPRGRLLLLLIGVASGAAIASIFAVASDGMARGQAAGNTEIAALVQNYREFRNEIVRGLGRGKKKRQEVGKEP
jgi:tyrosine-protein kinase Etk/Wzc